jgi:hypothetical protein
MAPRARFELATLRLTAEAVKNLSALSGVACKKSGAIFPSLAAPNVAPKTDRRTYGGKFMLRSRSWKRGRRGEANSSWTHSENRGGLVGAFAGNATYRVPTVSVIRPAAPNP